MKNEEKMKQVLDRMDNEFYPTDFIDHLRLMPLYVLMPFLNTNCIFNPETYTWTKKVVAEIEPKTTLEILEEIFKDLPNRFALIDFAQLLPNGFSNNEFLSYVDEFARPDNSSRGMFYIKFEPKIETKLTPEAINQMLDSAFEKMPNRFCVMDFASLLSMPFLYVKIVDYLNKVAKIDNKTNGMYYDKIEPTIVTEIEPKTDIELLNEAFNKMPNRFSVYDFASLVSKNINHQERWVYLNTMAKSDINTGYTFYDKIEPKTEPKTEAIDKVLGSESLRPWSFLYSRTIDYLNKVDKIKPTPETPLETEIFAAIILLKSKGYVIYKSC